MIYLLILIFAIIGVLKYDGKAYSKNGNTLYFSIYILTIVLAAFFKPVGGDCYVYLEKFADFQDITMLEFRDLEIGGRMQPLWFYFNSIIKFIYDNYNFYLFVHTIIVNGVIFYFISSNTKYKFTVLFLFLTTFQLFFFEFELQRESLAVCVGLLIYKYLIRKDYFRYYLGCCIAFLFHVSAIILFVIPIIIYLFTLKYKWYFPVIIGCIIVAICSVGSYIQLLSLVNMTDGIVDQFEYYDEISSNFTNNVISSLFTAITPLFFIIIAKRTHYRGEFFIDCAYLFLIFALCKPFVGIIWRMNNYILIPYYILLADILQIKKKTSTLIIITVAMVAMYINVVYLWTMKLDSNLGKINYYELFIPYRTIFE